MKFRLCFFLILLFVTASVRGQAVDAYFVVEVSDHEVVVGQPFIYSWSFYYSGDIDLDTANFIEPVFWGFSQRNLEDPVGRVEFIDGRLYSVITEEIRLVPSRSGDYLIRSYRVEFPASVFVEDGFEVRSESIQLSVSSLPELTSGDQFIGLVGDVDIEFSVSDDNVTRIGDFFEVRLVISGNANLDSISAPDLGLDSELYYVNLVDTRLQWESGLGGVKEFVWHIFPLVSGDVSVVFPSLVYFDTVVGDFRLVDSFELALSLNGLMTIGNSNLKFKPLSLHTSYLKLPDFFWLLWGIPLLIPVIMLLLKRSFRSQSSNNQEIPNHQALIQPISSDLPFVDQYLAILDQFRQYLYSKTGTRSNSELRQYLNFNYNTRLVTRILSLVDELESARYAPITSGDVSKLKNDVDRIMQYFESQSR